MILLLRKIIKKEIIFYKINQLALAQKIKFSKLKIGRNIIKLIQAFWIVKFFDFFIQK